MPENKRTNGHSKAVMSLPSRTLVRYGEVVNVPLLSHRAWTVRHGFRRWAGCKQTGHYQPTSEAIASVSDVSSLRYHLHHIISMRSAPWSSNIQALRTAFVCPFSWLRHDRRNYQIPLIVNLKSKAMFCKNVNCQLQTFIIFSCKTYRKTLHRVYITLQQHDGGK
jgi:hypothetical protein